MQGGDEACSAFCRDVGGVGDCVEIVDWVCKGEGRNGGRGDCQGGGEDEEGAHSGGFRREVGKGEMVYVQDG